MGLLFFLIIYRIQVRLIALLLVIVLFSSPVAWGQQSEDEFVMLSAYRDFFSQATDFSLSFLRYRHRGYDSKLNTLSWNGVPIENWESGTVSWNVLGNLSSIAVNSSSDNLLTYVADLKPGGRVGGSVSNRTYTYRAGARYVLSDVKGWSAALDISRRWGNSPSVEGVSADSYSFFATIARTFGKHSIELSLLYAPTLRTTQRASTKEAYELTGNNLYNPAWGYQSGKQRSVRQSNARQPMAQLTHAMQVGHRSTLRTTLSARIGSESYSSLTWQNTPNPYPDYYRYMPSAQGDADMQQTIRHAWMTDEQVRQIDFQNLADINGYNSPQAKYAIEERCRDLWESRLASSITGGTLSGGFAVLYAENHNYKRIADLLGAQYWLDIDSFVEQDDDVKDMVQNNIRNPNFQARQGDIFGYDYTMTMLRASGWASVERSFGEFGVSMRGEFTATRFQRTGHFEKENFDDVASYGASPVVSNYDYDLRAEGWYAAGGRLRLSAALGYRTMSPAPSQIFLSKEYRNATVSESRSDKITHVELRGDYRSPGVKLHGALYYTSIRDRTQLHNFYDDNIHQYVHYWMRGVDERYMGLELSAEFPIYRDLSLSAAVVLSDNRYTSNPEASQWRESTGALLRSDERVYYENLHVSGSPQSVAVLELSYSPRGFTVSGRVNSFGGNYIALSPLRRTDRAGVEPSRAMQERLSTGVTVDIFAGKSFYFNNRQSFGIYFGVNNLLDNRSIVTSGYESYRSTMGGASASRYYYALGINGFVSLSYNF